MRQKYERAKELAAEKLLPVSDLETAKANFDGAVAQLKANEAAESQSQANLNQAQVDLSHTIIATPIDGVVISRNVDVGQTVAASFQAPVLFLIANDLTRMRVNASIDEADVGRVREGQEVTFHVDAFPEREFAGTVEQVRLNPTSVQNVVTYNTIVAVDNKDLLLRPGMTATVSVIVRKAENALRLPAAALRFRPEGYERPTSGAAGGAGGGAGQRATGQGGPGGRRARSGDGCRASGRRGPRRAPRTAGRGERPQTRGRAVGRRRSPGGSGERPRLGPTHDGVRAGRDRAAEAVEVRVGISDGQHVELREGLDESAVVVTGSEIAGARAGAPARPGRLSQHQPVQPPVPAPPALSPWATRSSASSTSSARTRSATSRCTRCAACRSTSTRARCSRSWAPRARASRRS